MREIIEYITEDFAKVHQFDWVYEIQYKWLNFEVSLAYPVKTQISCLPKGTKVWRMDTSVLRECWRRNNPTKEVYV